jgi:diaminohydroxyphosphoribosylaminopyrimidine deaminase/5-amino-6-(5-phosphoribosylamino)uracil reductase
MTSTHRPGAAFDAGMMSIALAMARRGLGRTGQNPSVGAVIADEATGEVIARGWTQPGGRPHAEKEALARAGHRARGKTMYVTLEPCAHTGRTPTCADAVLTSGLARVVCAIPDPNPLIAGRGFEQIRAAGVRVEVGLMAQAATELTHGHILRLTAGRPHVTVKLAVSANGLVPRGQAGAPVWVSGPESRAYAHLVRAQSNAILVGSGTVAADDPDLTCRLPGLAWASPIRLVMDSRAQLPPTSRLASSTGRVPVWLLTAPGSDPQRRAALAAKGVDIIEVPEGPGGRGGDLQAVLALLASRGITRLMVEGGPTLAGRMLDTAADAVHIVTTAPILTDATGLLPFGDRPLSALTAHPGWNAEPARRLGADSLVVYTRRPRS